MQPSLCDVSLTGGSDSDSMAAGSVEWRCLRHEMGWSVMGKASQPSDLPGCSEIKKEAVAGSVGGFIHQLGPSNDGAYETVGSIHRPRF